MTGIRFQADQVSGAPITSLPPTYWATVRGGGGEQKPTKPTYSPAREGGSLAGSCQHWCSRAGEAGKWGHSTPREISPF